MNVPTFRVNRSDDDTDATTVSVNAWELTRSEVAALDAESRALWAEAVNFDACGCDGDEFCCAECGGTGKTPIVCDTCDAHPSECECGRGGECLGCPEVYSAEEAA